MIITILFIIYNIYVWLECIYKIVNEECVVMKYSKCK